ncbi:MAG: geranylgeranyl reductase family protein [Thermoprotei archaeon]
MDYDVIVVGAATTGAVAAKKLSEKGFKVLLLDAKPKEQIGNKACGDAIGEEDLKKAGVSLPSSVIRERIIGADLISPDGKTVFRIKGYGYTVDRIGLGSALIEEAESSGSKFVGNFHVDAPIIRDGRVIGVKGKEEITSRVVIDASGNKTKLRAALPDDWGVEKTVEKRDAVAAYRVIIEDMKPPIEHSYLRLIFDQNTSPGGYIWLFPEGRLSNVGLGVTMIGNYPNPKIATENWIKGKYEGKIVVGSGDTVPTRRPFATMVGNGILLAGDAAATVNPVTGGGIGSGMLSAKIAVEAVAKALDEADLPGINDLWRYNVNYMKEYGVKQAGLDVFRRFLIRLSNDDINFGMSSGIMDEETVTKAAVTGVVNINLRKEAEIVIKALKRPSMLLKLRQMASDVKAAMEIYSEYPDNFSGFWQWRKRADAFFANLSY